jgi:hypothetical protein
MAVRSKHSTEQKGPRFRPWTFSGPTRAVLQVFLASVTVHKLSVKPHIRIVDPRN